LNGVVTGRPPTTAKVENMGFVLVLSHSGQTWRWSRLA